MSINPYEVRQRVAAVVEALSGWKESRWTWAQFPAAEPGQYAHLAFAVGVISTKARGPVESSATARTVAMVDSEIGIRWAFITRADSAVSRMDAALQAEDAMVRAVLNCSRAGGLHLSWVESRRQIVGDGTVILGDTLFSAFHQYQL